MKLKISIFLFLVMRSISHNPVYNVAEADPQKDPNNPLVP